MWTGSQLQNQLLQAQLRQQQFLQLQHQPQ